MKQLLFFFQFILLCSLMVSCTEKADLDPREKFIQVHAILENSDKQKITLSYTSYVTDSLYLPVEDAEVSIEERRKDGVSNNYVFVGKGNGVWESVFKPVPRAEYRLKIKVPGFSEIKAVTEYPDTLKFVDYTLIQPEIPASQKQVPDIVLHEYKSDSCIIWVYYADYIPSKNNWEISDSIVVALVGGTEYNVSRDPQLYIPEVRAYIDEAWSCLPELWNRDRYKRYHGPGYYGVSQSIPFTAQYRGIDAELIGFVPNKNYIVLNGRKYKSSNSLYQRDELLHPDSYIMLQSVDKEYDRYMRECYAFDLGLYRKQESDLTFLWDYEEVYSNIENGVGIFGCTANCKLYLKDCKGTNQIPLWDLYDIVLPE